MTTTLAQDQTRTTNATVALIYSRISQDDLKLGRGVQRQLEDARHLVQQRGWTIGGEFSDNDISAFSGVDRPGYRNLCAAIATAHDRGGQVVVIVQHQSRLWRNRGERVAGIALLQRHRASVVPINGVPLDFSTSGGRFLSDLLGAFDTAESEVKSERLMDESRKRAEKGQPHGKAPYGWIRRYELRGGLPVSLGDFEDPETAPIVREIVQRVLHGENLTAIARDLNQRGVHSPGWYARRQPTGDETEEPKPISDTWLPISVKHLVVRESNVSQRKHRGKVVGPGTWPPLISQDDHDRARSILLAPERHQHRDGRRHHLLTNGIGVCGICGGVLGVRKKPYGMIYRCNPEGCVARRLSLVDDVVDAVMVARLGEPDVASAFDHDDAAALEARDRVAAVRARLNLAAAAFARGEIDAEQMKVVTAELRPGLEEAEADVKRYRTPALPPQVDGLLTAGGAERAAIWSAMSVTARRTIMAALGVSVTIMPKKRAGRGGFDPSEIIIEEARRGEPEVLR